jgi:hypothetical protein
MATIDNLKRSLLDLSDSELAELIQRRRFQRRVEKPKVVKTKAKKRAPQKKTKLPSDPKALAASLTPEQKKALAKLLLGG